MEYMQPFLLFQYIKRNTSTPRRLLGINICTNKIGVSVSCQRSCSSERNSRVSVSCHHNSQWNIQRNSRQHNNDATHLGLIPINSSLDLISNIFEQWIHQHSIKALVIGCSCEPGGQPKPEGVHVVRFIQDLSKRPEFQGLRYTYWCMDLTNQMVNETHVFGDDKELAAEHVSAKYLLKNYLEVMTRIGSDFRPLRTCSQVLNEFTEQCTAWADGNLKLGYPIQMAYRPWELCWRSGYGWMNTSDIKICRFKFIYKMTHTMMRKHNPAMTDPQLWKFEPEFAQTMMRRCKQRLHTDYDEDIQTQTKKAERRAKREKQSKEAMTRPKRRAQDDKGDVLRGCPRKCTISGKIKSELSNQI